MVGESNRSCLHARRNKPVPETEPCHAGERLVIRSQTEPLFFGRIRLLAQHEAVTPNGNHEHVFGASILSP